MEVGRISSAHSIHNQTSLNKTQLRKPMFVNFHFNSTPNSPFSSINRNISQFKLHTTISSTVSTESTAPPEAEFESNSEEEKFDWYSQWYPVMPVCDLDKRVPHAKKVMGIDMVVWWDRNENEWKVFEDLCPHRLAPLSEGRIDQWGRLQCVYHGWCFNGSGDCKFIPQAPPDGPPVHTSKKACVSIYPTTVQNEILWFWPNSDPQFKDILSFKKPPFIPELDDPSFTKSMGNRDMAYGYDLLVENLMDPAHIPYSHYGIMRIPNSKKRIKADREGGRPLELRVTKFGIDGFTGKQEWGNNKFIAPCIFYAFPDPVKDQEKDKESQGNGSVSSGGNKKDSLAKVSGRIALLIFICVPVSPGRSRLIWAFPRNFGKLINQIVPRWIFHLAQNLILDSDTYLLHLEEHKIMEIGPANWEKACYVPVKSDALVVAFRKWLNKYSGGQVDWRGKFSGALPPTPPREQLLDRYWTHVVNCRSCSSAHKALKALEVVLQVVSIVAIGIMAAMKQGAISTAAQTIVVSIAILCFAASRWLSHFIYKNFHFHDYYHALR